MPITVSFLSSSGDAIHTVECIGDPIYSLTCTCSGYRNLKCCKHVDALIEGDPLLADPTPFEGYPEACVALERSAIRLEYRKLLQDLAEIEIAKQQLIEDARSIRKRFYRRLAAGIATD